MGHKLGIDTGGTHTDLILIDDESGEMWTVKVPTTPGDPLEGILKGISRVMRLSDADVTELDELVYGTTIVTNMIVQHEAVKTGLITTRGFRDVLEIGRAYRVGNIYDISMDPPAPLVPRRLRMEVAERVNFQGRVLEPLDEDGCRATVRALKAQGIESIAVCLIHSYVNPVHEHLIKALIAEEYPEAHVSLSCEVNPVFREYERTSTTVVNAYVAPGMVEHLNGFEMKMSEAGFRGRLYTMQANGGKATFGAACERPVNVTNSGPIAGAIAGAYVGRLAGYRNAITLDMGGTSCDVALVEGGRPKFTTESTVEGYPVQIPTIDLSIVGAGGGSIALVDSSGRLRVGPESAGAHPGPVCYGLGGTEPTVTDAHLVAGRLDAGYYLGGEMPLDTEAAQAAIEDKVGQPLGMTVLEAALGILQVANANMVRAVKLISVEQGYDPRDFVLIAFGGAGPLHATQLAEDLEIPTVIVPRFPGNTSALGLVVANVRHDYVSTRIQGLDDVDPDTAAATFRDLESQARSQFAREGIPEGRQYLSRSCDLRYFGQAHELNVPVDSPVTTVRALRRIRDTFHTVHRRTYGHAMDGDPVEVVNYRVSAVEAGPEPKWAVHVRGNSSPSKGRRDVFFGDGHLHTSIYERRWLEPGAEIDGPAVIEQVGSTTLLYPYQGARVDEYGNLIITLSGDEGRNP